jgi:hypothetical protein
LTQTPPLFWKLPANITLSFHNILCYSTIIKPYIVYFVVRLPRNSGKRLKGKTGESPARSRHCKWGATLSDATVDRIDGKVQRSDDP